MDEIAVLESVAKTGRIVTAEEHQMHGGLGDSVAQLLARKLPTPMEMVAVNDQFGESGKPSELFEKYGLGSKSIVEAALRVMER